MLRGPVPSFQESREGDGERLMPDHLDSLRSSLVVDRLVHGIRQLVIDLDEVIAICRMLLDRAASLTRGAGLSGNSLTR